MVEEYFRELAQNSCFKLLIIFVVFDTTFGILRAIRERKINSCIGIDGMIRKSGMILSSLFLYIIDRLIDINFLGFIPDSFLNLVGIESVGIGELFGILFIIFESLSVLKNMYKCKMPIPKKLNEWLEKVLTEFTKEC
ncbi:phage holin family protein [Methanosphaera sp.]|uniref:phage holin family protein n=1 Tax=Methanosphaera sp. TaxID=2666342 RepID=UPI002E75B934|nr:phage holin family protein [Methanosphaera sp.]MEE1117634.1 phage holin family protein [Methanosphaera sp.]